MRPIGPGIDRVGQEARNMLQQLERQRLRELEYLAKGERLEIAIRLASRDQPVRV